MPEILLTRRLPAAVMAKLNAVGTVQICESATGSVPAEEIVRRVVGKDALVCMLTETIDRTVLEAADRLRIVANVAVGYNNIDVAAARDRGITVTNTPDVLT